MLNTFLTLVSFYLGVCTLEKIRTILIKRYQQYRQSLVDQRYIRNMRNSTSHASLSEVTFHGVDTVEWNWYEIHSDNWGVYLPYVVTDEILN